VLQLTVPYDCFNNLVFTCAHHTTQFALQPDPEVTGETRRSISDLPVLLAFDGGIPPPPAS
jgi:hypothetical protein